VNDHTLAVDVADLQVRHLGAPATGGIKGHEQDAMKGCQRCIDKTCHFLLAEYLRQMQDLLRIGRLRYTPSLLQYLDVKETQSCQALRYCVRRQLPLAKQERLIPADVLGA
jgi:hypothetical protein